VNIIVGSIIVKIKMGRSIKRRLTNDTAVSFYLWAQIKMATAGKRGRRTKLTQSPVSQATSGTRHIPPVQPRDCSITTRALVSVEESSIPAELQYMLFEHLARFE
jgi:hypothetical protein